MLKRERNMLWPFDGPAPAETRELEAEGHTVLRGAFAPDELQSLRDEILQVYAQYPCDRRAGLDTEAQAQQFRYQMFNRSALCQRALAHPRILAVVEPLLGEDCHVISCTAWRNPPGPVADPKAYFWHIDSGPHVPRAAGVAWPEAVPYPIFVIATHVYLDACTVDDGPTTVVPTSHRSGQPPPLARCFDPVLHYQDRRPVQHVVRAGDVGFFVSDVWHRRSLPTQRGRGRFFLQINYGRRDIAQRILPTSEVNHASEAARARAHTPREQMLIGLHPGNFYDG